MVDTYENLILLCRVDHKKVDDQPQYYTSARLIEIKLQHESWVERVLADVRDRSLRPASTYNDALHVLAVDDDTEELDSLVDLLRIEPRIRKVGVARDTSEALRYITATEHEPLDSWFVDISMPGLSGLDLARVAATLALPPGIVFVTVSETHAIHAFGLDAVDYLVKPVQSGRLTRTIDRIFRYRNSFMSEPKK